MKSEELKQLKAWILVGTLCFTLGACSEKKKEEVQETCEEVVTQYKDSNSYLIVFIEGKAFIYEESASYSTKEGYASIYQDHAFMNNCIKFASEVVGEENIIFLNFDNGYDLILKPNN